MYREHQPLISAWARKSPNNLARVIQFCIVSMHQKFFNVPALLEEAEAGNPAALFGWRFGAYHEAWERREEIFWHCEDIIRGEDAADHMLAYLASLHGLDVAKGGFVCQLAYGLSGCLDSVNNKRLGLPRFPRDFSRLRTPAGRRKRVRAYNALVASLGGTEHLWNDWCTTQAERYPGAFDTPHAVSQWHLICLRAGKNHA